MTESAQALIWSIGDIQDGRLWTFTVPHCQPAKQTAAMWRRTAYELKRSLGFRGIRVFEIHPNGHGLHVHVVTDKYFSVRSVRRITDRMGWGRLHVVRVKQGVACGVRMGHVGKYLAKYLAKGQKMRKEWGLKGFRMWASFGGHKDYIRVAQVAFETPVKAIINLLYGDEVIGFWGKGLIKGRRTFNYWRMRLACLIWSGRLGTLFEEKLEMALCPVPF